MSFVEVSPSILKQLYVTLTISDNAACIISPEIATSVVIKLRVVAILGWIMPLPFAMPPSLHFLPFKRNSTATSFWTVSVVIIAFAAASCPSMLNPSASSCIAFANGSTDIGAPMTPVEATITRSAVIPNSSAVNLQTAFATSTPLALQVFAFFEFTITACALPPLCARFAFVTKIGAPFTLF